MDSSPDSSEKINLLFVPAASEKNLNFIDTGSIVQTSESSEKPTLSSEKCKNASVTAQSPPGSPIPVPAAIFPAITTRPIHILDPSDIDPDPLPPPSLILTKAVAGKSKFFQHRKSIDATFASRD